jgi:hypothetical protein
MHPDAVQATLTGRKTSRSGSQSSSVSSTSGPSTPSTPTPDLPEQPAPPQLEHRVQGHSLDDQNTENLALKNGTLMMMMQNNETPTESSSSANEHSTSAPFNADNASIQCNSNNTNPQCNDGQECSSPVDSQNVISITTQDPGVLHLHTGSTSIFNETNDVFV